MQVTAIRACVPLSIPSTDSCACAAHASVLCAGKSQFVNYLLWCLREDYPNGDFLLEDNKRAAHERNIYLPGLNTEAAGAAAGAGGAAVAAATVQQGLSGAFVDRVIDSASSFAIFDQGGTSAAPARGLRCRAIVIASMDADHFKDFRGTYPLYVVDTAWSKEEIEQCYALVYSGVAKLADYQQRFLELGGLPRYVFAQDVDAAGARALFFQKFPSVHGLEMLLQQCKQVNSAAAIHVKEGAKLVTFDIDNDFHEVGMRWVSDAVGEHAMRMLFVGREVAAAQLLFGLAQGDERGAFGCAFESYAHLQLAKGGQFRTRAAGAGGAATADLKLDLANTVWYARGQEALVPNKVWLRRSDQTLISIVLPVLASDIALCARCVLLAVQGYGRPQSKQAESIDAIVQPDKLFQMTVSLNKNLKEAGLEAALAGMRSKAAGSVSVYIAVPDSQFPNFNSVTHRGAAGAVAWPAAVALPIMVVSIPMQSLCSVSGHAHTRADLVAAAKVKLRGQAPAFPGGDAAIDELLAHGNITDDDLKELAGKGIQQMRGYSPTWVRICHLPAAHPTCTVYRRKGQIIHSKYKV